MDNRFIRVKWGGLLGDSENCVFLPPQVLRKLGIAHQSNVALKIGSLRQFVTVSHLHSNNNNEPIIFFSENIVSECQIPTGTMITAKYSRDTGQLQIGPLIGLLAVKNLTPEGGYGTQEPILKALAESGPKLSGFVFVFCPENIYWDNGTVNGYIISNEPDDTPGVAIAWVLVKLPLPDVIYDRIPSRTAEMRPEVRETKARLQTIGDIFYFNPKFLDKWETHLILKGNPDIAEFLPPTKLVETPEDIKEFLNLYGSIFLKPSSGSLGRRIIKVTFKNNSYEYMYRSREKQTVTGIAQDSDSLIRQLRPATGKRPYIVQKDLKLARYENCPFDVRVLAQKDMRGNWRRTKTYVRVAAPDNFLSNLSDGARPLAIKTILHEVFGCDYLAKDGIGEAIRNAVDKIPAALEKETGCLWGELGIDLGLDNRGRIWLIEINSKPFRALVSDSGSLKLIERSFMRPLEYGKYIAGFYRHSPELCVETQGGLL